jgi:mono/diheme cytochrome c family protein
MKIWDAVIADAEAAVHTPRRSEVACSSWLRVVPLCFGLMTFASGASAETALEHGAYLVEGIANCGNCHAPQEPSGALPLTPLSGGPAISTPAFTAYPSNITPDQGTGIGGWTAEQVVMALREGRTPDGRVLRPPMPVPFYRGMSDEDAYAIATYVLSRQPVSNKAPSSQYKLPVPASYGPPVGHVAAPPQTDRVAYGSYLGSLGHCMLCHTPLGPEGQRDYAHRLGAGGLVMEGVFGRTVTANITPEEGTGLGHWTDDQIKRALAQGERPDGRRLASPMPVAYLARLKPDDLDALVVWLRSLKPIRNQVTR